MAIDPAANYAQAITTPGRLSNAVIVVDHFHIVALGDAAVTKVRRRVIWESQGQAGARSTPRGRTGAAYSPPANRQPHVRHRRSVYRA